MNKISEIGEKELIQILLDKRDNLLKVTEDYLIKSYHDDSALILNHEKHTVLSTDMLIQHSHFPKQMTPYQMGAKIVTVNVSDIISMNATPISILISMGLPEEMTINEYEELTDGILDKCEEYNITLIGGDINQNDEIVLSGTSIGEVNDNFKLQSGIIEGNLVAVTGKLGGPAAALDLLMNSQYTEEKYEKIINTLLSPTLPFEEFEILKQYPEIITSMTDITDGLAVELGHLSDKNKDIGFEIFFDKLPYYPELIKISKDNNKDLLEYLLHFGEEFELLMTLDSNEYLKHKTELKNIHIIGKTNNSGKIVLIRDDDEELIPTTGYEHLKVD